ncbi:UPF0721 transmembrane protein [Leminorella grimontii]|uniref:Probable membrane transporter protein n=1 Tax=Leminorella grimontii TaxID=82981 RepID=A0AAV5N2G0_9GAMM|nr:sulfite exporter TauE/SafE family protein [Leminorella grimontii]KFC95890.1 uncharacterized DUF81 family protein [Leminorella grimontii ATCC 33999 = DSM 5078]GKX54931.1 UPF0721 transmembrane protein [Leminorella grimontii]VFS58071.1 Sulfite exporter TauE/SafE [Leminorella grimontii]
MAIEWVAAYLALGAVVGFMAGLLGIGGGGIMVPILTAIFAAQGTPPEHLVHMALGTSMASIVFTAISSLRAHHKHQAVLWPVVWKITPAILLGTLSATWLAAMLPTKALGIFFSCFMGYVALQMILNIKPKPSRQLPGMVGTSIVGLSIGGISALVAIGGGSLTVSFLSWCNVRIQNAIGTSAAVGLPIALSGSIGYMINGWGSAGTPDYSIGYVYLPAVILISVVSYFTAPLGAKLAHRLPVATLKKVFACLLILLSLKMLQTIFFN